MHTHDLRPAAAVSPSRAVILALALVLLLPARSSRAQEAPGFLPADPCPVEAPAEARCGHVAVPEDPQRPDGRWLDLLVVVVPGTAAEGSEKALAFLAGGPGDSSTRMAAGVAHWMADLRATHDLLFVDQRGTGGSNALRCPHQDESRRVADYLDEFMNVGRLLECRRTLERAADLTLYTTPFAADDLDTVRETLGYRSLDLVGVSYGTRLAQVYTRRHPEHARTLTLLGPVSLDARMPLDMARDFDRSLRAMFNLCVASPDCARVFPDLPGDLERALARVDAGVEPVTSGVSGEASVLSVTRPVFAQGLRYMLYHPASQVRIPLTVHEAGKGNFEPLAEFVSFISSSLNTTAADGLYLSVTCVEDVARFGLAEGREAARDTVLGEFRVNQQKAACALWPLGRLPEGYHEPVAVDTPTLLIVGENDPATPPRWAREIAAHLPHSLLVVVPQAGHEASEGLLGADCIDGLTRRLLADGDLSGLDVSCVADVRLPEFATAPDPDPVQLPAETLMEIVGTYGNDEVTLSIEIVDGTLRADAMGQTFALAPLSNARLKIEGAPPGFAIVVERDAEGRVVRVVLEQGPESRMPLERRD